MTNNGAIHNKRNGKTLNQINGKKHLSRLCSLLGTLLISLTVFRANAVEGMWTLDNLPKSLLHTQYDFDPGDQWISKVTHASLRLQPGCSASFVSTMGLVLTNHHCVRRCLEDISTPKNDLIARGFLAASREQEIKCPQLELNQLQQTTDVTDEIQAETQGKTGQAFTLAYNKVTASITSACIEGHPEYDLRCDIVTLYHGGKYFLYRYHRYQDVRLVWAPEFAIAFFGGDPDNFNFPRYDLDASILRAFENGKPAITPDFFQINSSGSRPHELTMVTGHPGSTQRELTLDQLLAQRDKRLIRLAFLYSELRGVLQQYRKSSREAARVATTDLFSIENSLKVFRGQLTDLHSDVLLNKKRSDDASLQQFVIAHDKFKETATAWQDIAKAEQVYREIGDEHFFLETSRGIQSKYWTFARTLVRAAIERTKPNADRLPEFTDAALPGMEQSLFSTAPVYPELEKVKLSWSLTKLREWLGADHPIVKKVFGKESPDALAARLISGTHLGDVKTRHMLWDKSELIATSNDPLIKLLLLIEPDSRAIRSRFDNDVDGVIQRAGHAIAEARFAMNGTNTYPDATFTLRLSFGEVKGWQESGHEVDPFTTVDGAFKRHTGSDPFSLPPSWLSAQSHLNGAVPFNFVTTNDITGGNSGSPVINRNAELVGLIFDGNIHSLGGAFGFDENVNRAVAVHPAALLQALREIYKADALLKELNAK